jgi:hypothetical protein
MYLDTLLTVSGQVNQSSDLPVRNVVQHSGNVATRIFAVVHAESLICEAAVDDGGTWFSWIPFCIFLLI